MKVPFSCVNQLLVLVLVAPSSECKSTLFAYKRPFPTMSGALMLHQEVLVPELDVALVARKGTLVEMYCPDVLVEVRALLEGRDAVRTPQGRFHTLYHAARRWW